MEPALLLASGNKRMHKEHTLAKQHTRRVQYTADKVTAAALMPCHDLPDSLHLHVCVDTTYTETARAEAPECEESCLVAMGKDIRQLISCMVLNKGEQS